jgi:hypothetical protein
MSGARPFETRIVACLPPAAAGAPAEWAATMSAAGVDGLALDGTPEDPPARALLRALRAATPLPLELHVPPGADWTSPDPTSLDLDWLIPADAPSPEAEAMWKAAGIGLAWPLGAPLPTRPARVHAWAPVEPPAWKVVPAGAERSLRAEPEGLPGGWAGVDTVVVPGEALAGTDPGAEVARWREGR